MASAIPPLATAQVKTSSAPFPAPTKQAAAMINGTKTEVWCVKFVDKILLNVSCAGAGLGHWVHVPLLSTDPTHSDRQPQHAISYEDEEIPPGSDLLPLPHLTATTILGAGVAERDTFGQLLATQLATAIVTKNPDENRLLVLGMGLGKDLLAGSDVDDDGEEQIRRQVFVQLVGLCVSVL